MTTTIDGVVVENSLAKAHGIPPTSHLYYIYNLGLDFMTSHYPAQVAALLYWRTKHREVLLGRREEVEGQDFEQPGVYFRQLAAKAGLSLNDYIASLRKDTVPEWMILRNIIPSSPMSRAMKSCSCIRFLSDM